VGLEFLAEYVGYEAFIVDDAYSCFTSHSVSGDSFGNDSPILAIT
jgi:hypothetical protein